MGESIYLLLTEYKGMNVHMSTWNVYRDSEMPSALRNEFRAFMSSDPSLGSVFVVEDGSVRRYLMRIGYDSARASGLI